VAALILLAVVGVSAAALGYVLLRDELVMERDLRSASSIVDTDPAESSSLPSSPQPSEATITSEPGEREAPATPPSRAPAQADPATMDAGTVQVDESWMPGNLADPDGTASKSLQPLGGAKLPD
jgi:hypothetical protein